MLERALDATGPLLGTPITAPSSSSKSRRSVGPKRGPSAPGSWPRGRRTGVPETTTVPERP